jgi:hypothetical protein
MNRKILSDSTESHQAYEEIQSLTRQYNQLQGGKWRGLMDAAPRKLPVFDDVHGHLSAISHQPSAISLQPAYDYKEASEGTHIIEMLGHSMKAVAMPKGGTLTYQFTIEHAGNYTIQTALIPTQPNDNGDLRYSVSVDGSEPVVYSLKEPFRSERWKLNVLSGQAIREWTHPLTQGTHTLTIHALDDHIVIDQIIYKES